MCVCVLDSERGRERLEKSVCVCVLDSEGGREREIERERLEKRGK